MLALTECDDPYMRADIMTNIKKVYSLVVVINISEY